MSHGTNNVGEKHRTAQKGGRNSYRAQVWFRRLVILFHCESTRAGLGIFMSNKLNVINDLFSDKEGSKQF